MNYYSPSVTGAILLFLLSAGSNLQAELIPWSYAWESEPGEVLADNPGTGKLILSDEPFKTATGNSDIVATNIKSESTAGPEAPDVFTKAGYTLTLTLIDDLSGESGSIVFTGEFDGTMTAFSSNIESTPTGDPEKSIVLGLHRYTISMGPYSPPGPPGSTNVGSIAAHAQVRVEKLIHDVPEPSSLVLAGLSVAVLGSVRRWMA